MLVRLAAAVRGRCDAEALAVMAAARRRLLADTTELLLHDPGAGPGGRGGGVRRSTVAAVARRSSGAAAYHRLLCRLAELAGDGIILELGTALGLGTLALAAGAPAATLHTIEGDPALARRAATLFRQQGLRRTTLHTSTFDEVLPSLTRRLPRLDLLFLDGHHEKDATLRYFSLLLPLLHPESLVIVDDIRWSRGMWQAWQTLRRHHRVTASVDLLRMGILLFEPAPHRRRLTWWPHLSH